MQKIKIAIVGVCISRDAFSTRLVPNYKTWYEVVNTTFKSSIISLMTPSIELSEEDAKDTCQAPAHRQNLKDEMSKVYMKKLIDSSPDYIVMDLYSEIRYGIVRLKNTYLTNASDKIKQTNFYKQNKYDEIVTYTKHKEKYMILLNEYLDKFMTLIKEQLPKTKVILVKGQYAHSYVDDDNIIKYVDLKRFNFIDFENKCWKELNEYVQNKYNLQAIDMTNKEYFADPHYPFGFAPWHYEPQFYKDFIDQFNSICLRDILEERY